MPTPTPVVMPRLGETVVEGTVARWFKTLGDPVAKLEPLLAISTDKIDTEVPAPATGILLAIHVAEGVTVEAGTVLAIIGNADDALPTPATEMQSPPDAALARAGAAAQVAAAPAVEKQLPERPMGRRYISPVVKRLVQEHGIDIAQVTGTGLGGRVTRQDVVAHMAAQTSARGAPRADAAGSGETLHPLTPMRRAIAQHMVQSVRTSPHVATIFEVDMTAVVRHRETHKQAYAARGVRLSYTPYFVAAVAVALRAHAHVNSRYTEAGIVEVHPIHIGVAVALPGRGADTGGLIAPVIRNADALDLPALARAVDDLATRARTNSLSPDDLQGGTFTLTNHGVGGSLIGTPIINQPQAAILGVGAIAKRPVVRASGPSLLPSADDAIVIRPMCYLTLSFDHRILDGAAADAFMRAVAAGLEGWAEE